MHGFVKDEDDQPIDGARITVANRRHDIFSARDGDYWRLLVPGSYEITVSAKGFEPDTKSCTVLSDKAAKLNFALKKMRMREPRHQVQMDMWPRERIPIEDDYRRDQDKDPSLYRDASENRDANQRRTSNLRTGLNDEPSDDYFDVQRRMSYDGYGRHARSFPHPK